MRPAFSVNSGHKEFLSSCLSWLAKTKSLGPRKLPCFLGWQMAIDGLKQFWDNQRSEYKLSFLLTNRLNQECWENLFSVIRGKGGYRDNPNAGQFRSSFRQVMVDTIMVPSAGAHCEDTDVFLVTLRNLGISGLAKSKMGVSNSVLLKPELIEGRKILQTRLATRRKQFLSLYYWVHCA